jgi:hypothetical protein
MIKTSIPPRIKSGSGFFGVMLEARGVPAKDDQSIAVK